MQTIFFSSDFDIVNEWKANTVIKNPKSHVNNILGNITLSWYSGVPIKQAMSSAGSAFKAASKPGHIKAMPNWDEAAEAGLFGRTSLDEMINQVTGIESKFKPKNLPLNANKSNLYLGKDSKVGKKIYGAYRDEDDAFKLSNYNYWRDQGLDPKAAREKVELAIFDYAKQMPKGLNYLRDTGLIPFISFQYKSIPLLAKTLADSPSKIAGTSAALYGINAITGGDTEPGAGKLRVNDTDINTGQWTPYQEYLKPMETGAGFLFGGMPQNVLGLATDKDMSFGRPRGISKQDDTATTTAGKFIKKSLDVLPIPAVYKAAGRIGLDIKDKDRNPVESGIDRLLIGNKPKRKTKRKRRPNRKPR